MNGEPAQDATGDAAAASDPHQVQEQHHMEDGELPPHDALDEQGDGYLPFDDLPPHDPQPDFFLVQVAQRIDKLGEQLQRLVPAMQTRPATNVQRAQLDRAAAQMARAVAGARASPLSSSSSPLHIVARPLVQTASEIRADQHAFEQLAAEIAQWHEPAGTGLGSGVHDDHPGAVGADADAGGDADGDHGDVHAEHLAHEEAEEQVQPAEFEMHVPFYANHSQNLLATPQMAPAMPQRTISGLALSDAAGAASAPGDTGAIEPPVLPVLAQEPVRNAAETSHEQPPLPLQQGRGAKARKPAGGRKKGAAAAASAAAGGSGDMIDEQKQGTAVEVGAAAHSRKRNAPAVAPPALPPRIPTEDDELFAELNAVLHGTTVSKAAAVAAEAFANAASEEEEQEQGEEAKEHPSFLPRSPTGKKRKKAPKAPKAPRAAVAAEQGVGIAAAPAVSSHAAAAAAGQKHPGAGGARSTVPVVRKRGRRKAAELELIRAAESRRKDPDEAKRASEAAMDVLGALADLPEGVSMPPPLPRPPQHVARGAGKRMKPTMIAAAASSDVSSLPATPQLRAASARFMLPSVSAVHAAAHAASSADFSKSAPFLPPMAPTLPTVAMGSSSPLFSSAGSEAGFSFFSLDQAEQEDIEAQEQQHAAAAAAAASTEKPRPNKARSAAAAPKAATSNGAAAAADAPAKRKPGRPRKQADEDGEAAPAAKAPRQRAQSRGGGATAAAGRGGSARGRAAAAPVFAAAAAAPSSVLALAASLRAREEAAADTKRLLAELQQFAVEGVAAAQANVVEQFAAAAQAAEQQEGDVEPMDEGEEF